MVTGYVSIWKGIVCVLPLTSINGTWIGSGYDRQDVVTDTYNGKKQSFNVIHYSMVDEYGNDPFVWSGE